MNQAQALYQLQNIDLKISKLKARLATIEQLLAEDTRVLAAEQTVQQASNELAPWPPRVRDLELEIKTLGNKMAGVEQRLYSGSVSNPKELQDMQEEVASLKRRRTKLEDDLLEAMISLEHHQQALAESQSLLQQVQSEWTSDQTELVSERNTLNNQLDDLNQRRKASQAAVTPENLQLYESLCDSMRGRVVSPLVDSVCRVCGVGQTTTDIQNIRRGQTLVRCSNCGRILVLP